MRRRVCSLVAALTIAACEDPAPRITPEPAEPPAAPAAASAPAPAAPAADEPERPWAVRLVRSCTDWASAALGASDHRVVACNKAVWDRESGALVRFAPRDRPFLAGLGEWTYWRDRDRALLLAERLDEPARVAAREHLGLQRVGGELVAIGARRLYRVRGAELVPLEGSETCADALAVGLDGERVLCLVREGETTTLRTVGGADASEGLPGFGTARWTGRHFVATRGARAHWIDASGAVVHTEDGVAALLDVAPDGRLLVATSEQTELWRWGDGLLREAVYARAADAGAFTAGEVVLVVQSRTIVWLHRGEPRAAPTGLPAPEPPPGFAPLRADVDDGAASFEGGGGVYPRDMDDVAAFVRARPWTYVVVSRSDAAELSRASDDAAWASMAAARYLDAGEQRWARSWRGEEGRVVRGHVYIGGCERAHVDVAIRERGDVLEQWTVTSGRDGAAASVLGPIPDDAAEVPDARADAYRGDPSIGELE